MPRWHWCWRPGPWPWWRPLRAWQSRTGRPASPLPCCRRCRWRCRRWGPPVGWVWGAYVSELRGRAARSRREQELETGRAVAEEQARVGRELHDVIAHTLSVIVIQAGAALDVFETSPQAARQALGSIGSAGRQAPARPPPGPQGVPPPP